MPSPCKKGQIHKRAASLLSCSFGMTAKLLAADHYVEDILDSFKFEHLERDGKIYLLYKNRQNEVRLHHPISCHFQGAYQ